MKAAKRAAFFEARPVARDEGDQLDLACGLVDKRVRDPPAEQAFALLL
jgi:hypothetical protein